jgi:hypothetical protein
MAPAKGGGSRRAGHAELLDPSLVGVGGDIHPRQSTGRRRSAQSFRFVLANVHLFFGSDRPEDMARRALEAYAVARWADLRRKDKHAYASDIIALGDFNLPHVAPDDPIYTALTKRGLVLPEHSTEVGGSSLGGHKHYDQMAFFPGKTREFNERIGPFDFDNAVFRELWDPNRPAPFLAYARYYVSDHRPLCAEFKV